MKEYKEVFSIIPDEKKGGPKWVRVGTAYVNKDSSLNVVLDVFPLDGKLHIRDPKRNQESTSSE